MRILLRSAVILAALSTPIMADAPATQPVESMKVSRKALSFKHATDATVIPGDAYEAKLKLKTFAGDLPIAFIAANNSTIKAGEKLFAIDPSDFQRALATAENELKLAKANYEKAESDMTLLAAADTLALDQAKKDLANAQSGLKWWEDVDGKQMLQSADLQVKQVKDSIGDQEDELDQLRKMYKSEDLTNATADIVVKRAVRQLEQTKINLQMTEARVEKTKKQDYPIARDSVAVNVERTKQALDQLQAQQKQSLVQREAALATAKATFETAERKVADLKNDEKQLTITAPYNGILLYGQFTGEAWQNDDPKLLATGEKAATDHALFTFVRLNKATVKFDLPESKKGFLIAGPKVYLSPESQPQLTFIQPVARVGKTVSGKVELFVDLVTSDLTLLPGSKLKVLLDAGEDKDALVIPLSALQFGKVKIGNELRTVQLGRTDGESIEVISGVKEGEELAPAGSK